MREGIERMRKTRLWLALAPLLTGLLYLQLTLGASWAALSPTILPVPGKITSPFGTRVHPITGQKRFHSGIDIGAPNGKTIFARQPGEVIYNGSQPGYGRVVVIQHHPLVHTLYAHLSGSLVKTGDWVTANQPIARVGQSGSATGPHLHFETHLNTHPTNPMSYLKYLQQHLAMMDLTFAPMLAHAKPTPRNVFYPHTHDEIELVSSVTSTVSYQGNALQPPPTLKNVLDAWQASWTE